MLRLRIRHLMILIAVLAPVLLGIRVLLERDSSFESIGRKMIASALFIMGGIVASCFSVAYIRDSPEEWKRRFSSASMDRERAEDWAQIERQWRRLAGLIRWMFRRFR
jgi:hypothetical protein